MSAGFSSISSKSVFSLIFVATLVAPVVALAQTSFDGWVGQTPSDTALVDSVGVVPPSTTPAVTTPAPAVVSSPPPPTTQAQASFGNQDAGIFSKGQKRVTATAGWGHSFDDDYILLGIGAGYFLANGLSLGLDFEAWLLGDPTVYKLSPRADYVLWQMARLKPYAGAFYRRSYIGGGGIDDQNSLGGRAGAFYKGVRGGMAGAGVVYERYLSNNTGYSSDVFYPEFFVAVSF